MKDELTTYVLRNSRTLLLVVLLALLVTVGMVGEVAAHPPAGVPPSCEALLPSGLLVDCNY